MHIEDEYLLFETRRRNRYYIESYDRDTNINYSKPGSLPEEYYSFYKCL